MTTNTTTPATALVASTGVLTQDQALNILNGLLANPNANVAEIPQIYQNIIGVHNTAFAAPVPVVEKKRRRRRSTNPLSPNLGWPAGVSRAEYKEFKEARIAAGEAPEALNPQEYKRRKEAGDLTKPVPAIAVTTQTQAPEPTPEPNPAPAAKATTGGKGKDKGQAATVDTSSQGGATSGQRKAPAKVKK